MNVERIQPNIAFKRALNEDEKREFKTVLRQAKAEIANGGKSILIVHEPCLPQAKETDTGIGHLTSQTSLNFFDFAKNYLGINTIEVLPPGEIEFKGKRGFYNTYNGSALSLGVQGINLELLTVPDKNGISLLSEADLCEVVRKNAENQTEGLVNYENIIGKKSAQELALHKAYEKFKALEFTGLINTSYYNDFKKENADWLERKALYQIIKERNGGRPWQQWDSDIYKNLFVNIDEKKRARIDKLKSIYADKIEFYIFKQYLADRHLRLGREKLNEKGLKLFGDCLIGFSNDEVWAYRDAFKFDSKGNTVKAGLTEWKIPALNYDTILDKDSSAQKLLRNKVRLFANRYDGIRFDCAWSYVTPKLSDGSKFDFGGKLLDIIEETVKEEKGENYCQNDLIYEFEASPKDFSLFDKSGKIKSFLKKRVKIITSANMDDNYGTAYSMRKLDAKPDSYIIGVGNHDPQPLRQIADGIPETVNGKILKRKEGQINILQNIFNISRNVLTSPTNFVRYKFAEPLTAKNNMVFYMDVFGRSERFDSQTENRRQNYRQRIPENFEKAYQDAVESKYGYNPADAMAKVFKKKGLNIKNKELYEKLIKFANILYEISQNIQPETDDKNNDSSKKEGKNKALKLTGGAALGAGLIAAVIALAKKGLSSL